MIGTTHFILILWIIIMNRFSQLVRRTIAEPPLRKKRGGIDMELRKEIRRLKKINTFSRQFTGQQNEHGWFTPRRYKALGQFIEATRNVHPGTLPIKPELKKQISEKFVEDSHWFYYNFRNYMSQILRQQEIRTKTVVDAQISHLPAHFRDELNKKEEEQKLPNTIHPSFIYNVQYNIYMPLDERYRMNLILKIDNPPESKDEEEEKQIKEALED